MRVRLFLFVAALSVAPPASAGTVFLLDGRGWGHGVGMSQWGAEGFARHGWDYRRILAHYYPGTRLESWRPKPVRVLLAESSAKVRIASSAPFAVVDAKGRRLHLPPRAIVLDKRLLLKKKRLVPPLRVKPGAQPLTFDLQGYRGELVVKRRGGTLMVVNEVALDRYLRGVVPWEVPTGWHQAAYESQAVAARTYALATLHPGNDYDLLPDSRDQMYGGIRAERPQTNHALGTTAGQVLTYGGQPIRAYYFSTSGGRTSSVHDAWPQQAQVPYLVSVADPYDYISPHHSWPTQVLSPALVGRKLGVSGVRDLVVERDSSSHAAALRVLTARGWNRIGAQAIRKKLGLGSTDFDVHAMTLDEPSGRALYGEQVKLSGWVRGLGRARLQAWTGTGWRVVAHVRPGPDGRFSIPFRAWTSTELRLAYNGVAGAMVPLRVAPRVDVAHDGTKLRVRVAPSLPLQIERLTDAQWRPVARGQGSFARELKPGSYRVAVAGGTRYVSAVSRPVGLR